MSNRLGKLLFWGLHAFVLLFLAAAMSMPAAATTGGEQVAGLGLLAVAFAVFLWCSIWPARFFLGGDDGYPASGSGAASAGGRSGALADADRPCCGPGWAPCSGDWPWTIRPRRA